MLGLRADGAEQATAWAYPQPEWSDHEVAFTLCNPLFGRVHLSGHIDRMSTAQEQLVADAISTYKRIRPHLAAAVPFWPLELPGWTDPWVSLGIRTTSRSYVVVWSRGPIGSAWGQMGRQAPRDPPSWPCGLLIWAVRVAHMGGAHATPEVLYPVLGGAVVDWSLQRAS